MSLWLFRAGRNGEYEEKFLTDGRVYLTWDDFNIDLNTINSQEDLYNILIDVFVNRKLYHISIENWAS